MHKKFPYNINTELNPIFNAVYDFSVFKDSKTIVDCIPKYDPQIILKEFSKLEPINNRSLLEFVKYYFGVPTDHTCETKEIQSINIEDHISQLWNELKRCSEYEERSSLLPLKHPYFVPGGRFRELYYWDSFYTMLGLYKSGYKEHALNTVDNFHHMVQTYGFIPNGNRSYYLTRSQPPFFTLMVVLSSGGNKNSIIKYLPSIEREYQFWMSGVEELNLNNTAYKRVVRMPDGEILNRYWDSEDQPRPESYKEDIELLSKISTSNSSDGVFRNIRAAAESGWDFSSRWFKDGKSIESINTTDIVPVDLNCLLYYQEYIMSRCYELISDESKAYEYKNRYEMRKKAILKYFWNPDTAFFHDFNFVKKRTTSVYSLASTFPLFFSVVDQEIANRVSLKLELDFLKPGGLVTTLNDTTQQWDSPNGWAPLQWIAIVGLRKYGQWTLADKVKNRWISLNERVFNKTGKMMEKYNVIDIHKEGGGGEYPLQDGFGWTNGVYLWLTRSKERENSSLFF